MAKRLLGRAATLPTEEVPKGYIDALPGVYPPYTTQSSGSDKTNYWARIARVSLPSQYLDASVLVRALANGDGDSSAEEVEFRIRVKWQNTAPSDPLVDYSLTRGGKYTKPANLQYVVVSNAGPIVVDFYLQINTGFRNFILQPLVADDAQYFSPIVNEALIQTLPSGARADTTSTMAGTEPIYGRPNGIDPATIYSRTIATGTGLQGGGDLSADRTLSLTAAVITSLGKADSALQAAPVTSVAGRTGAVTLAKADVGLSNVDNTADTAKPISTAQQSALNAKAATATTVSAGTGLQGGGDLSANRTLALSTAAQASLALVDAALPQGGRLGSASKDISGLDLNLIYENGFYNGQNMTNAPLAATSWFLVQVMSYSGGPQAYITQQAVGFTGSAINKVYQRTRDGSIWTSWVEMTAVTSVAGRTGSVVVSKSDVGLSNVDNTSDINKPVSNPQATYINQQIQGARDSSAYIQTIVDPTAGYRYELIRITLAGSTFSDVFKKQFGNDYQAQGRTGTAFVPPRVTPMDMFNSNGFDIVSNAGGWRTSGNVGEIVGCQIMDGVIYHDFDSPSDPVLAGQQGLWSMGFRADGTSKIYTVANGDTAAKMVADGVRDSFSFGPALVINSVAQNLEANTALGLFNTEVSARQILGQANNGDIILISVYGKSGVYGIKGNEIAALALRSGCVNAIMLDGGGSAQTVVSGVWAHPSSDSLLTRQVAGFLSVRTRVVNEPDTGWLPLTLASGWSSASDASAQSPRTPQVRRKNGRVMIRGRAIPSGGTLAANTWVTPFNLPLDMVSPNESVSAVALGVASTAAPVTASASILGGDTAYQFKASAAVTRVDFTIPPFEQLP